jgi:tetratricopeptide (TPR) repeat protein
MARSARGHTAWRWVVAVGWLVGSLTAVSAQDGRWERLTALGAQAVAQGDYAEAARQFQAALPLADVGSLAPSCMHLAAVYEAQGQYPEAALLYRRALVLQEQIVGPDHAQLVDVLEAAAALQRKMYPVRSLLPWSAASQMTARATRIRAREEQALLQGFLWGPLDTRQAFNDSGSGE